MEQLGRMTVRHTYHMSRTEKLWVQGWNIWNLVCWAYNVKKSYSRGSWVDIWGIVIFKRYMSDWREVRIMMTHATVLSLPMDIYFALKFMMVKESHLLIYWKCEFHSNSCAKFWETEQWKKCNREGEQQERGGGGGQSDTGPFKHRFEVIMVEPIYIEFRLLYSPTLQVYWYIKLTYWRLLVEGKQLFSWLGWKS